MLRNSENTADGRGWTTLVFSADINQYIGSGALFYPSSAGVDLSDMIGLAADFWMRGSSGFIGVGKLRGTNDGVNWYDVFSAGLAAVGNSFGALFQPLVPFSLPKRVRWEVTVTSAGPIVASGGCGAGASIFARSAVPLFT